MDDQSPTTIQNQMASIRAELDEDVEQVVEQAKDLVDWRRFVEKHPWLTLGAAAAAGFMIVPAKTSRLQPDADTLEKLVREKKIVIQANTATTKSGGVIAPVVSFVSAALLRSALAIAGQKLGQVFAVDQESASSQSRMPSETTYESRDA